MYDENRCNGLCEYCTLDCATANVPSDCDDFEDELYDEYWIEGQNE